MAWDAACPTRRRLAAWARVSRLPAAPETESAAIERPFGSDDRDSDAAESRHGLLVVEGDALQPDGLKLVGEQLRVDDRLRRAADQAGVEGRCGGGFVVGKQYLAETRAVGRDATADSRGDLTARCPCSLFSRRCRYRAAPPDGPSRAIARKVREKWCQCVANPVMVGRIHHSTEVIESLTQPVGVANSLDDAIGDQRGKRRCAVDLLRSYDGRARSS